MGDGIRVGWDGGGRLCRWWGVVGSAGGRGIGDGGGRGIGGAEGWGRGGGGGVGLMRCGSILWWRLQCGTHRRSRMRCLP
jgi:hypothetical protein